MKLATLLLAVLLAACNESTTGSLSLDVKVDAETGCQYLGYMARGITPRIAADGKTHMGCRS